MTRLEFVGNRDWYRRIPETFGNNIGVGVVGIGVGVNGVRKGSSATPGLELLKIGSGMKNF